MYCHDAHHTFTQATTTQYRLQCCKREKHLDVNMVADLGLRHAMKKRRNTEFPLTGRMTYDHRCQQRCWWCDLHKVRAL